jgi:deazaflavin-dependent oxidoreductase (nitroreductase family)
MSAGHRPLQLRLIGLAHRVAHRVSGGRIGSLEPGRHAPTGRVLEAITALHKRVYRLTGGLVGGDAGGLPTLLLTTTGWKSGVKRTAPLPYFTDVNRLLLVGSFAGNQSDPAWCKNLSANPDAEVQVGFRKRRVRAHRATGDERAILWSKITAQAPMYADYQHVTAREIPVMVLTPE